MSNAGWCCSLEDGNGMWYTPEYPEEVFFEHWTFMAERYLDNPLVIGADLRNEVRYIEGNHFIGKDGSDLLRFKKSTSLYCKFEFWLDV